MIFSLKVSTVIISLVLRSGYLWGIVRSYLDLSFQTPFPASSAGGQNRVPDVFLRL